MSCRNEYPTRNNRAPFLRIQHALSEISEYWMRNLIHRALRLQFMNMRRKVRAWTRDTTVLRRSCRELFQKYKADPTSVTLEDWDRVTADKEKKLQITYGKHYTKEQLPRTVIWLNLMAYAQYGAAKAARKAKHAEQKGRKAEALKKKAEAAAKIAETAAKKSKALQKEKNNADSIPWGDPVAMEALFKASDHNKKQMGRQPELLRRSCSNPIWVSYE
jgi:hypothetical protein